VNFIEKEAGRTISQKAYTDTGPILERDFAQQAGLGWIGKNTCLIHPRFGSYFLLAEVFLELELEPDEPVMHDYCGSCQRCIEACPTGCILPDRTLDATHCISYQTIENKGSIPDELRPLMGDWIFGCDICQQVCPWNLRFGSRRGDPELSAREGVPQPDLRAEIHITPEQFNRKFRESPIQRPRRRGYLRNVAVALGNLADPATLPDLAEALLQEPEPLVRGHAAWAIGQIDTPSARDTLQMAMRNETDGQVLSEIRSALREG
jgi:epoxyqueuosine reductase